MQKSVVFIKKVLYLQPKTKTQSTMIRNYTYTSRDFNRNFKVKIYGNGINKAVGFTGFLAAVGDEGLAHRLLDRAYACMDDVCHCKLRRGIKISFYNA